MRNAAFSLVELSIVLVILGLLVGGILAGQSLIRASELRAMASEYNRYVTATHTFKDKYFGYPGDITNATQIWGAAAAGAACATTATTTGTATCDGNGDGAISSVTNTNEPFRYWQQLANAGLIEGQYDGITHGATSYSATTANSPVSKLGGALWFVYGWGVLSGDGTRFDGDYTHMYEYGGYNLNNDPTNRVMTPSELWNIDTKLDDGQPGNGILVTRLWTETACVTASSSGDKTATYVLSGTAKACIPIFRHMF